MPSADKGLGVTTRLLKNWPGAQNSNWYKKGIAALVLGRCKAVEDDEDHKVFIKMRRVKQPSSCPMSMFTEL